VKNKGGGKMIEKVFKMTRDKNPIAEKVVMDENLHYIHMAFAKDGELPEHYANSNVYMTVVRGVLSIGLDEQEVHTYPEGTVLKIPEGTKMNVRNLNYEVLELIVVKVPAPGL
jgi:quercetin dioxygenase-like cupin family protein